LLIKLVGIAVLMAASTIAGVIATLFHIIMFITRRAKIRAGRPSPRQRAAYSAHLDEVERFLMATQRRRDAEEADLT
jgi:hypothetical protein